MHNLDRKDFEILRELDINYRQSLSSIAKKVNLSKNTVSLRFEKLQDHISHSVVAINHARLGYSQLRVFYSFDYYNKAMENEIIKELSKYNCVSWSARLYGRYDLCIGIYVRYLQDYVNQIMSFNRRFKSRITSKELQIVSEYYHQRHNFIHDNPILNSRWGTIKQEPFELRETQKKILIALMTDPRMSISAIGRRTGYSTKTVTTTIKNLEKERVILGYYPTFLPVHFDFVTFKLLLQVRDHPKKREFRLFLSTLKNVRFISREVGIWDYEIDCVYPNMTSLQEQLEQIYERFPGIIKQLEIMSFRRKIYSNMFKYLK